MNWIDYIKNRVVLVVPILLLAISCTEQPLKKYTMSGFALGTTYKVVYLDTHESVTRSDVQALLKQFEKSCSIFDSTSLLSRINADLTDSIDLNIYNCLVIAERVSQQSDGMYDVTVKPLVSAYGFAGAEAVEHPNIDSIMQFVGYQKLQFVEGRITKPKGVQIDLNSIAKGYSVDLVSKMLDSLGIVNHLAEIGGEIYAQGVNGEGEEWKIGIDKPFDGNYSPGEYLQTIIPISNRALASSGNYRRYYVDQDGNRINHTINPKTGKSDTTTLLNATVIASTCVEADAYATALMSMGTEKAIAFLKNHPELSAYLIYSSGEDDLVYEQ